jgi:hypothetical protein
MTHTTKTRTAEPAPWFRAWPGVEQSLTEGMTSRELALWYSLRLKFWAAGCRPMTLAAIERAAALQGHYDKAPEATDWVNSILVSERGLAELPDEGWVFVDLQEQHAETILARGKAAEAGRKGGLMKKQTATAPAAPQTNGVDAGDF